jgi:hypothetical protein
MFPRLLVVAAALVASTLAPTSPAPAKTPKPKLRILGFTTDPLSLTPQASNGETLSTCVESGSGQRTVRAIYKGKGIKKGRRVGVALWGPPQVTGITEEPTDADTQKDGFKWPVPAKRSYTGPYGMSFANGPFGPQQIDGVWNAKVVLKGKAVARASVTIACR